MNQSKRPEDLTVNLLCNLLDRPLPMRPLKSYYHPEDSFGTKRSLCRGLITFRELLFTLAIKALENAGSSMKRPSNTISVSDVEVCAIESTADLRAVLKPVSIDDPAKADDKILVHRLRLTYQPDALIQLVKLIRTLQERLQEPALGL